MAIAICSIQALAQVQDDFGNPPPWNWAQNFGGSGNDYGYGITTDESGNIYVAGTFSGDIYFEADIISSAGNWDGFIAKYNSTGNLVWFRNYEAASPDHRLVFKAIDRDAQGRIYITGFYTGDLTLGDFSLPDYSSDINFFFARLDEEGDVELAINPDIDFLYAGHCIKTDENSNIFIIGANMQYAYYTDITTVLCYDNSGNLSWTYSSEASFYDLEIFNDKVYYSGTIMEEGYIGSFYLDPLYSMDAFLARSDLEGNFEWAGIPTHNSSGGFSQGCSIYLDEAGNIYQSGDFGKDVVFGQTNLTEYSGSFALKANQNGGYLWACSTIWYAGDQDICGNADMAVIYDGTLTILDCSTGQKLTSVYPGYYPDRIHYCKGTNHVLTTGDFENNVYISALDADLNELWMKQFNGDTGFGHNIGISADYNGHFYAFSYASAKMDYFGQEVDKGLILAKQDLSGNIEWLWQFQGGTIWPDIGCYIKVDSLRNCLYVTGTFNEPFVIPGITTLIPGESGGFYIIKIDLEGNFQWVIQEEGNISHNCLAIDYSGNVLLSGVFLDATLAIGYEVLQNAGYDDVFIAKYSSDGNWIWALRGGGESTEFCGLISTDKYDNIFLAGEFTSENVTLNEESITLGEGDGNVFFAKLSPNGQVLWMDSKAGSPIYLGDYYCWPSSIITDPDGYSYIKGWHHDSTYFDSFLLTNPYSKIKKYNYFIAKFDPSGNTIWAHSINESRIGNDNNQMDLDRAGNVYLGAQITDTVWFEDDYQQVCNGYMNGFRDLFVAKYTSDGELDWVRLMTSSYSEWANSSPSISCVTAIDVDRLLIGGRFTNHLELTPFSLFSLNIHGMVAFLGEPTWIPEEGHNDKGDFEIFPNPATKMITIRFLQPDQDVERIAISDVSGRVFIEKVGIRETDQVNIDVSSLTPGLYIVYIEGNDRLEPGKFVISK